MTAPALAAARFSAACLLGMGLGILYSFLRPLRPRLTVLADLLFVLGFGWAWVYLGFAICQGDLRVGYYSGLILGLLLWEYTAGKLLRPLFFGFWGIVRKILALFLQPVARFFRFIPGICKKIFAYPKKSGTIKGDRNETHYRKENGHERKCFDL